MSIEYVAQRLEDQGYPIHADSLSRLEKGHRRIRVDDLYAIANVLGVRPEALLAGEVQVP